jgi:hypothetical protein
VDISDILRKYADAEFLLVKMDIEGSEFPVLRKSILDGTIVHIDHLFVEWHGQYVKGEDDMTVEALKNQIIHSGVSLGEWR